MLQKIFILLGIIMLNQTLLYAEDTFEPNDTLAEAKLLESGVYEQLSAQTIDWFKLNLYSGSVELTMTPVSGADVNMILYNDSDQVIASDLQLGQEHIQATITKSGTYYIKIEFVGGSSPEYSLNIGVNTNVIWEKTLDFGPISDVSVALYDIDNDGKDEIFVGTSKAIDSDLNEVRPAGLICLEDDGSIKWTRTFPAMTTKDIQTEKLYQTTSVSSAPFFSDIDNDGKMEILVGVGAGYDAFNYSGGLIVGQPGDKGGLYALEDDGTIKWFHESLDVIGGRDNVGDNRPDGVYGSPIVYDIDNDGAREVIYNSWDQRTWVLNASTGEEKKQIHLYDTIWSTPAIADINNDGKEEMLITADITANPAVGTQTGGIFHVIAPTGIQNISGFDQSVANPTYTELRGKFEEEVLWSSPITADIDNDGFLEIVYGTGNYTQDKGEFIRVWDHDGASKFKLPTVGKTFATPLVADIDNDGELDIVAATLEGYVYAWDNQGDVIFTAHIDNNPIFSSPIALDINNDDKLEIIYTSGVQITILSAQGERINEKNAFINQFSKGSPAVKDIDNDGVLDLISGGTTDSKNQAVVYRWILSGSSSASRIGRYQYIGSFTSVRNFVAGFYKKILNRAGDVSGLNDWTDRLVTGTYAAADIARGFIYSDEFINRNLDDDVYVDVLYTAFFDRPADQAGFDHWTTILSNASTSEEISKAKNEVLEGFLKSQEFSNLAKAYNIKPIKETNLNADIEAFTTRFYNEILNRTPDSTGLNDWIAQLASGTRSASDIAIGFIASDEFTNRSTTETEYVTILYKAFFDREPDDGITGWVDLIQQGGNTLASRLTVLDGFLNSQEFVNLANSYGIRATN